MNSNSLATLPKFLPAVDSTLETMKKTGLGSSAALVTSLTAALLAYFNASPVPSKSSSCSQESLALLHNLAQYCHCMAQGKIGSGFDVSSAVYGSQRYVRFSKEVLEPLLRKVSLLCQHVHLSCELLGIYLCRPPLQWKSYSEY